ncbi:MAG TPA: VWA domain-containing protein [Pyrinomonadaceae bacterium]|jgi:Ca-activated chloride channel family protein
MRAPTLTAALLLAALVGVPPASTQNRARGTSRPAGPAQKSQGPVVVPGPYVRPSADDAEPPALPGRRGGAEVGPREDAAGRQTGDAGRPREEVDEDEVVRINASEVLLPVTVRDASGALVTNLGREDFKVFEDGREQPLSDISLRRVPLDVALLVDASSSVAESFEDFRRAAEEFAGRIGEEDRFCLVKFDDRVELLLDWSKSRLQLRRALARLTTGVFTRFNDALLLSAREQFRPGERRRALVFLSDGIDSNRGAATIEAAQRALLETQVTVYGIANTEIERARKRAELDNLLGGTDAAVRFNQLRIGDLQESLRVLELSERNLEALTRSTGGRLYRPHSFHSLGRVYTEIADELRHQYALYYTPTNAARDGRFRRVRVEVAGRGYEVSTRVGYYAPVKGSRQ